MIFITDDDVVLKQFPKKVAKVAILTKVVLNDSPFIDVAGNFWKSNYLERPISNKTKNKLMSLLTKKE